MHSALRGCARIAKIPLRGLPTPESTLAAATMNQSAPARKVDAKSAPQRPIPNKLYFPIREVAELTGVEAYVLRFWEKEFPMLQPVKESSGHRRYRRKDIEMVLEIKRLLYDEGFTIPGARTTLQRGTQGPTLFAIPPTESRKKGGRKTPAKSPEEMLRRIRAELDDILTLLK